MKAIFNSLKGITFHSPPSTFHFPPFFFCLILSACGSEKKREHPLYEGPLVTLKNVDMLVSDSSVLKIRLAAKTQLELKNKDRDFPDGIFVRFYNALGLVISVLAANKGYYYSGENYYKAEGDVVMRNLFTGDELSTELLNWKPSEHLVYTDNFVTIKTEDEVLTGEGLEAYEDFEEYTILKPSGTMSILKSED